MTKQLVIHPSTVRQTKAFVASPHHAMLLIGADGVGKTSIVTRLAAELLAISEDKLAQYPYYLFLEPAETGTVSIEMVRGIQKFLQLKTTGTNPIRRIVCLEHADGLTKEAQNALLKLLEEPPADTVIILAVQSKRALLPTILSRVQTLQVTPPLQEELEAFFADKTSSKDDVRKAYFLSGGLPGLMAGILTNDQQHPLLSQVAVAKELLQKPLYERLGMIDTLTKQKTTLASLLEALARIADSGLRQASVTQDDKNLRRWHGIKKEIFEAQEGLSCSANSKLVLTKMLLHM